MTPVGELPGRRIGRYTVLRRLGSGGMGQVYLARSPGGRLVAVKRMHEEFVHDPRFRERFGIECAAAQRVSGAFTAPVLDYDAHDPLPWLATAFVDAPTLAETVDRQGPLRGEPLRRLAAGLAEALGSVHAAGVVHRDLKPSNILMAPDGPRVIDFGLARAVDHPAPEAGPGPEPAAAPRGTVSGRRPIGTPGYISPERWRGEPTTEAADLFSLGGVLHYAATGRNAFGSGPAELVQARAAALEPEVGEIADPLVRMIAARCLSRDPRDRPSTREVLTMLNGTPHGAQNADRGGRRRAGLRVGAAAGAVVVVAVCVVLAMTLSSRPGNTGGFAWSVPESQTSNALVGLWSESDSVVLGTVGGGLTGYAPATGARLWTWRPPNGDRLCGMSQDTDEGMAAFDYGPPVAGSSVVSCDELQVVALHTGRLGWPAALSLSAGSAAGSPDQSGGKALSVDDGLVSAAYAAPADASGGLTPDTDLLTASLSTGKSEWSTDFGQNALPDGCVLNGQAQLMHGRLYSIGVCDDGSRVSLLEVEGGAATDVDEVGVLTHCGADTDDADRIFLAADPDYLLVSCAESEDDDRFDTEQFYGLRAGSSAPVYLAFDGQALSQAASDGDLALPGGVVLADSTLYAAASSSPSADPTPGPDMIIALDLATGKELWSRPFAAASLVEPLVATQAGVQIVSASPVPGASVLETLSASSGAPIANRALSPSMAAAFAATTTGADPPYAAAVGGSGLAVAFPTASQPGQTMLAVFALPGRGPDE